MKFGEERAVDEFEILKRVDCKHQRVLLRVRDKKTDEVGILLVQLIDGEMTKTGILYPM